MYQCVAVHYRGNFAEPTVLGDVLANYVDEGGVVIFSDGFTGVDNASFTIDRGVKGRISEEGYSPIGPVGGFTEGGTVYNRDGTTQIYEGVDTNFRSIANNRDIDFPLQGDGITDGTFEDGNIAAAYRPDFRVIFLGGSYCWGDVIDGNCPGGDSLRRWVNACSMANTEFTVPPVIVPSPAIVPTRAPSVEEAQGIEDLTSSPTVVHPDSPGDVYGKDGTMTSTKKKSKKNKSQRKSAKAKRGQWGKNGKDGTMTSTKKKSKKNKSQRNSAKTKRGQRGKKSTPKRSKRSH